MCLNAKAGAKNFFQQIIVPKGALGVVIKKQHVKGELILAGELAVGKVFELISPRFAQCVDFLGIDDDCSQGDLFWGNTKFFRKSQSVVEILRYWKQPPGGIVLPCIAQILDFQRTGDWSKSRFLRRRGEQSYNKRAARGGLCFWGRRDFRVDRFMGNPSGDSFLLSYWKEKDSML